jgi:multicomponent K+:H+ antiporter subunit G
MSIWAEYLIAILILVGASFTLLGSISLARMPDFFMRLHGPTKVTSLGVGSMAVASAIYFSVSTPDISLHELAVSIFLFITAPLSAHLLAKVALHIADEPDSDKEE